MSDDVGMSGFRSACVSVCAARCWEYSSRWVIQSFEPVSRLRRIHLCAAVLHVAFLLDYWLQSPTQQLTMYTFVACHLDVHILKLSAVLFELNDLSISLPYGTDGLTRRATHIWPSKLSSNSNNRAITIVVARTKSVSLIGYKWLEKCQCFGKVYKPLLSQF